MVTRKQEFQPWHTKLSDAVLANFETPARGLTDQEVLERQAEYGPSLLPERRPTPLWLTIFRQFISPLIYILVAAAVVSAIIGDLEDAAKALSWQQRQQRMSDNLLSMCWAAAVVNPLC